MNTDYVPFTATDPAVAFDYIRESLDAAYGYDSNTGRYVTPTISSHESNADDEDEWDEDDNWDDDDEDDWDYDDEGNIIYDPDSWKAEEFWRAQPVEVRWKMEIPHLTDLPEDELAGQMRGFYAGGILGDNLDKLMDMSFAEGVPQTSWILDEDGEPNEPDLSVPEKYYRTLERKPLLSHNMYTAISRLYACKETENEPKKIAIRQAVLEDNRDKTDDEKARRINEVLLEAFAMPDFIVEESPIGDQHRSNLIRFQCDRYWFTTWEGMVKYVRLILPAVQAVIVDGWWDQGAGDSPHRGDELTPFDERLPHILVSLLPDEEQAAAWAPFQQDLGDFQPEDIDGPYWYVEHGWVHESWLSTLPADLLEAYGLERYIKAAA